MPEDHPQHQQLLQALLRPEHFEPWHYNATFKYSVETLARMLPAWIDGLAAAATDQDVLTQRMKQEAMRSMTPGFTYNPATGDIQHTEP